MQRTSRAKRLPAHHPRKLAKRLADGSSGVAQLAAVCSVTGPAVYQWGTLLPLHHVAAVAKATGIPAAKIRPDFYGAVILRRVLNAHKKSGRSARHA